MQVAVEPFIFLLLLANIQYFSVLMDGQLSKGCRFDALRDLRDMRLALLCLICKLSDVSANHLCSSYQLYCQNRSLASNVRFLYPQNFRSKSVRTSVYKHD